jgi:hypothetical protein
MRPGSEQCLGNGYLGCDKAYHADDDERPQHVGCGRRASIRGHALSADLSRAGTDPVKQQVRSGKMVGTQATQVPLTAEKKPFDLRSFRFSMRSAASITVGTTRYQGWRHNPHVYSV